MKCPNCKKTINSVRVFSQCGQTGYLKDKSRKISWYDNDITVMETLDIECPECATSIKDKVEE
jgi:hypothetical protein